ncbi:MAG: nuclear transport factor 2 family protein [Pseudomonadota bacterium]|nr:nuclear transport factor 2 family protein [Pseudomonadota bacterium]
MSVMPVEVDAGDRSAIRDLKARYCVLFDNRRFAEWAELFTGDAVIDMRDDMPEGGVLRGGGQFFALRIPELLGTPRTFHRVHEPVISFESSTSAKGIWPMEDLVVWPSDHGDDRSGKRLHGYGWYYEDYVLLEGQWRILRLKLVRQHLDLTSV